MLASVHQCGVTRQKGVRQLDGLMVSLGDISRSEVESRLSASGSPLLLVDVMLSLNVITLCLEEFTVSCV